jgi:hypothetical protein
MPFDKSFFFCFYLNRLPFGKDLADVFVRRISPTVRRESSRGVSLLFYYHTEII